MTHATIFSSILLSACNQWVRPAPPDPAVRSVEDQRIMSVMVESTCDPFYDGGNTRKGSGVIVSDWQVLTALHVVDCSAAVAQIHVTSDRGRWRFSPEKEWESLDVSRIQMASGDTLHLKVNPPEIRLDSLEHRESVYIYTAYPKWGEKIGEAFGGSTYGSARIKYKADTTSGNSGSPVYDHDGNLVGIHLGSYGSNIRYASRVTAEMVPYR